MPPSYNPVKAIGGSLILYLVFLVPVLLSGAKKSFNPGRTRGTTGPGIVLYLLAAISYLSANRHSLGTLPLQLRIAAQMAWFSTALTFLIIQFIKPSPRKKIRILALVIAVGGLFFLGLISFSRPSVHSFNDNDCFRHMSNIESRFELYRLEFDTAPVTNFHGPLYDDRSPGSTLIQAKYLSKIAECPANFAVWRTFPLFLQTVIRIHDYRYHALIENGSLKEISCPHHGVHEKSDSGFGT